MSKGRAQTARPASEAGEDRRRGSGWFGPDDPERKHVVGRDDSLIEPGGGISRLIEDTPAGYSFGANHDNFVGWATGHGAPDLLVNLPSLPPALGYSILTETINTPVYIINDVLRTNIPPPFQYWYPLKPGSTPAQ